MHSQVLLPTFALLLQVSIISGQRQWVSPTTTAAEMRNPYTWYWPYALAAAESYRNFFANAQQITNQLYAQAYTTNAFWWSSGGRPGGGPGQIVGPGGPAGQAGGAAGQAGGAAGQAGGAAGQAGGAAGQAGGAAGGATNNPGGRPIPNMSQGGNGWR